jgi:hypothetical protein
MSLASVALYISEAKFTSPATLADWTRGSALAVRYSPPLDLAAGELVMASSSSMPKLYGSAFLDTLSTNGEMLADYIN